MTIYASKTAESMNTDPYPYIGEWDGIEGHVPNRYDCVQCAPMIGDVATFAPRPEFTPPTTHEANPILMALRGYVNNGGSLPRDAAAILRALGHNALTWSATPDQIDHAKRVLTRLASLTKEDVL